MQVANLNILVPVLWFAHNRLNVRSTFILIRRSLKDKKNKRGRWRIARYSQERDERATANDPLGSFLATQKNLSHMTS
ncbi:Uncharacterised protein [Budvicia aquatica]|uniref:Uncharacterized protein n=1 Tax=Budvicia aquatica TaxID=82979 RepID=A0A484Z9V3_9GAMM|nr:Uncharacterised protein [Budvicia aquatica]